jgi:hypothetical protein
MEEIGNIIKSIGKLLKVLLKMSLYIFWGLSRVAETVLHETNSLLKKILEDSKR